MTKAFVINLEHRTDRFGRIKKDCENLKSIKIERFNALKGEPGWKYCGLSHLEIIKQNIHTNESILIFEDDCHIQDIHLFDDRWSNIKNWLDNNLDKWDIFNGGPTYVEQSKYLKLVNKNLNIVEVNVGKTTHFIYYNKNSFDKILKWNSNNNIQIDEFHKWDDTLKILTSYPYLATQYNTYSDVSNFDINFDKYFRRSQKTIRNYLNCYNF